MPPKFPRPPKSIPSKLPKPPPSLPKAPRALAEPAYPTFKHAPQISRREQTDRERYQKVWEARPKLEDVKLTEEQMRAPEHRARVQRWRQWPMFFALFATFGLGVYGSQLYISLTREQDVGEIPEDLRDRFDREAEGYDEKVNVAETLLRISSRRKKLMQRAHGHVLEVAVGTGRNIPYYPTKFCATVTLLDSSAPMLAVAKRKWKDTHPEYFSRVFFKHHSAVEPITPPFDAQGGYDSVVQTMGLCSTHEPVKLLQNLEACTKEDGQILLLEHGKSHYQWLNDFLDKSAPAHAKEHGCWWNKDIGKIVEDSGLEVVNIRRYNFGTTWWVELKPRRGMQNKQAQPVVIADRPSVPAESAPEPQRPWWSLWR